MTTQLERRVIPLHSAELKFAGKQGEFSGYGAYYGNKDAHGDVIAAGSSSNSLEEWKERGKWPPMLLQHGGFGIGADDMLPIGEWTHMEENNRGLKVDGRLFAMNTERGQYVYEGLKSGVLDGLSIGFRVRAEEVGEKPGERIIKDIDLWEVSVVTFPANTRARVTTVKSLTVEELRDLEVALGERGVSRKDRGIAVAYFKQWLQRDAGEPGNAPREEVAPDEVEKLLEELQAKVCAGSFRRRQ
jgi:hypothetical protein